MSYIFGIFNLDNQSKESNSLRKMQSKLSMVNHDRSETWEEQGIGLGQVMRCITPESVTEKLPYEEDGLIITSNARIDNRSELLKLLGFSKLHQERPDSWLIMEAYRKWRQNCPKYLLGEYTFAIWDKNKKSLFCAKDYMGTRPFFYTKTNGKFLFASEIGGLFSSGLVVSELNKVILATHLIGFKGELAQTSYKKVFKLPPAHWMEITTDSIRIQRYWEANPYEELKLKDKREYQEAFVEKLKLSVKRRVRTNFPVGSLLSGGLDSTSITGIALKENLASSPLYLYSWVHAKGEEQEYADDREYINSFLQFHSGTKYKHQFYSGLDGYFKLLPQLQPLFDEPFRDLELYTRFQSYQQAEKHQVRTLLSGVGGDEFLSAYAKEYVFGMLLQLKFAKAVRELQNIKKSTGYSSRYILKVHILSHLKSLALGKPNWGTGNSQSGQNFLAKQIKKGAHYLNNTFLEDSMLKDFIEGHPSTSNLPFALKNPLKSQLKLSLNDGGLDVSFNQRYQVSLKYGVEYAYPFLDRELVEFCLSLPNEQFFNNGMGRGLIRNNMKNYVPKEILSRRSKYVTSPNIQKKRIAEAQWLKTQLDSWEKNLLVKEYINTKKLRLDLGKMINSQFQPTSNFVRTLFLAHFFHQQK